MAIGIAIFAGVFLYGLRALSPTVTVGDAGEFIAAAQTLALPHAPSYPLLTLLGRAFLAGVPFGNPGFRMNLLSAACGAGLAAGFYGFLVSGLRLSKVAALAAVLVLASSGLFSETTAVTEAFALNALLATMILWASSSSNPVPLRSRSIFCGFLTGLGLGNHHTLVLILPGAVYFLWRSYVREFGKGGAALRELGRDIFPALAFGLLGISIYAFLPIRSQINPPLDWSNPENWTNFWRVLTRADYGGMALALGEKLPRNVPNALRQVERYFGFMAQDLTWPVLVSSLLGLALACVRDLYGGIALNLIFLLSGICFLVLGNLPFDSQSGGILPRFYLLPLIPLCAGWGIAGESLKKRLGPRAGWIFLAGTFAFAAVKIAPGRSRNDWGCYDYGRNILRTLPPRSVLFMDGGDDTFYSLAYLTLAEGRRPDLELHDRGGLIFPNPYGDDFRRIPKERKESRRRDVESGYWGRKPLFYATFDKGILPGAVLRQRGILYQAYPAFQAAPQTGDPFWHLYSLRGIYVQENRPYRLRALLPLYPFFEGLESNRLDLLKRAAGFGKDIGWLGANIEWELAHRAYEAVQEGKWSEAESRYRLILSLNPRSSSSYSNLGVIAERTGKLDQAETYYRKAVETDPDNADVYYNLGVLYWKRQKWEEVSALFEKTLRLNPRHAAAARYLELARKKARNP